MMRMFMTRIAIKCVLFVGLICMAYAAYLFGVNPSLKSDAQDEITLEGSHFGNAPINRIVRAKITVVNKSRFPIRFLGGPDGCQPGGCIKMTGECPQIIDPHSSRDIPLLVSVSQLGNCSLIINVYLDTGGKSTLHQVQIMGCGLPVDVEHSIFTPKSTKME
jgi:hypothetical protein